MKNYKISSQKEKEIQKMKDVIKSFFTVLSDAEVQEAVIDGAADIATAVAILENTAQKAVKKAFLKGKLKLG